MGSSGLLNCASSHSPLISTTSINTNPQLINNCNPLMFSINRPPQFCRLRSKLPSTLSFSPKFDSIMMSNYRPEQTRSFPALFSATSRNLSHICQSSLWSQNGSNDQHHQQFLHHISLNMIVTIITFIWRIPGIISEFLNKEEKLIDKVEEDVNEAADAIKLGAKVVEGLADGIEKVAEALDEKDAEKLAKTVEEDAKRVEVVMDKVKERVKIARDEIEEARNSLGASMQDVEKVTAEVQLKGQHAPKESTTDSTTMQDVDKVTTKVEIKGQQAPKESTTDSTTVTITSSTTDSQAMTDANIEQTHPPLDKLTNFLPPKLLLSLLRSMPNPFEQFLAHPILWTHYFYVPSSRRKLVKALILSSFVMSLLFMPLPLLLVA